MAETPIPEFLYDIPDDAPEAVKLHLRAQRVIQAAFYAFGDSDERPGTLTLSADDLTQVLDTAVAMMIAAHTGGATRQDLRREVERHGKIIRMTAEALRHDTTPRQLLEALGMAVSKPL